MPAETRALYSGNSLIATLQQCRHRKDLLQAQRLYARIQQPHLDTYPFLGNYLVPLFVDCRSLPDAQHVFDRLVHRTERCWTSLISGYSNFGDPQHAFHLYHKMQEEKSAQPTTYTYVALLAACARLEDTTKSHDIHTDTTKRGLEKDMYVGSTLLDTYTKCGSLAEAHQVFGDMPFRDAVLWTALIAGYAERALGEEVLSSIKDMQLEGVSGDAVTFLCSLKACALTRALETGEGIYAEITKRGMERELHVGSTLVDMYGKCGFLEEAHRVFDMLAVQDTVSWNALITGYVEYGQIEEALSCTKHMELEGVPADSVTFMCSLKACGILEDLEIGWKIHTELIKRGFEGELHVGSTLVDMYGKCGLLAEACIVFDMLPAQDVVSWNALIAGYAEHGLGEQVLNCSGQMLLKDVTADAVTFALCLKACGILGDLEAGRGIYSQILKAGLERDPFVSHMLLDMYSKCGSGVEGHEVFNKLAVQDVAVWNSVIGGYSELGLVEEVLHYSQQMQGEGVPLDVVTYVFCLKACGTLRALEAGQKFHADITKRGLERELYIGCTLVDMYGNCYSLTEAHQVFDRLPIRTAVTCTALLAGYAECGLDYEILDCFQQCQLEGVLMEASMFVLFLKASISIENLKRGQEIHAEIVKRGLEKELNVSSTLVDMYGKCGLLAEAHHLFNKLSARDAGSWNALVAGHAEHGLDEKILSLFRQMQLEDVSLDATTFVWSIKSCGNLKALETGQKLHTEVSERGYEKELYVGGLLVDMYGKCGLLEAAESVFDRLPVQDTVSWNALIAGYAEHGVAEEVLNCYRKMQWKGVSADVVTFSLCLKACGMLGAVDMGKVIDAEIRKLGLERDPVIGHMVVDMYGKCGAVAEGQQVFNKLPVRDVVSWTAMIRVYGENHEGNLAVQCFEDMQKQGVKPNSVTFTCLLAACSHSSLVLEGQEYFKLMTDKYELEPTSDHYACMVDLFARAGHVFEAEKFLAAMQRPPSSVILITLLNACIIYGKVELGQRCLRQLIEMDQEIGAAYLLMADVYASAGRWNDANKVEKTRKYVGANKKPGSALIEVNKELHQFVVCGNQSEVIFEMLEVQSLYTKNQGYIPNLDLVSGV